MNIKTDSAGRKVMEIDNEKDLRTYMQPQRLDILFLLESRPEGMTAKQVADALHMAPSSAGHHLRKLEQLGLVKIARTQLIHGFKAKFYTTTDITVTINAVRENKGLLNHALMQNILAQRVGRVMDLGQMMEEGRVEKAPGNTTLNYGTLFLTREEAQGFLEEMNRFVNAHRTRRPGTQAFEYTLMLANLDLWRQHTGDTGAAGGTGG